MLKFKMTKLQCSRNSKNKDNLKDFFLLSIENIKKYPNTNTKQSQGIRQRMQSESKRKNEQPPVSLFQRDTIQTKSMQEKVRGNGFL